MGVHVFGRAKAATDRDEQLRSRSQVIKAGGIACSVTTIFVLGVVASFEYITSEKQNIEGKVHSNARFLTMTQADRPEMVRGLPELDKYSNHILGFVGYQQRVECAEYRGIDLPNTRGCCAETCGRKYCGTPICQKGPGGAADCCQHNLSQVYCSAEQMAPCLLNTTHLAQKFENEKCQNHAGIDSKDNLACCPATCGEFCGSNFCEKFNPVGSAVSEWNECCPELYILECGPGVKAPCFFSRPTVFTTTTTSTVTTITTMLAVTTSTSTSSTTYTTSTQKPPWAIVPQCSWGELVGRGRTKDCQQGKARIIVAFATLLLLLALVIYGCCWRTSEKWKYRPMSMDDDLPAALVERKKYALEELQKSFDSRDAFKYLASLELALDAQVEACDIPLVYSLHRVPETFKPPHISYDASPVSVQLCFILDYTGSMSKQIEQAKDSCMKVIESMKNVKFRHMPNATIDLELAAVGYNDWDDETRLKKDRPVLMVLRGREIKQQHDNTLSAKDFNLGGSFVKDADEVKKWMDQKLGSGGKVPEELTGALIAASHLPWRAQHRLAIVVTDAPCHGKAYSNDEHDPFCDQTTGLTCTGKPEVPLLSLKEKGVRTVILHTGQAGVVQMCKQFLLTDPDLFHEHTPPAKTAERIISVLKQKVDVEPLSYSLRSFGLQKTDAGVEGPPVGWFQSVRLTDVAVDHVVDVTVDKTKASHRTSADGLIWLGKPSSNPKIVVTRPADPTLDAWWVAQTKQYEINRTFDMERFFKLRMDVVGESSSRHLSTSKQSSREVSRR